MVGLARIPPAEQPRREGSPCAACSRRCIGTAGFSLVEVLVTVAIVGTALTVLVGILRTQVRTLSALRHHTEARLHLEQSTDRFQLGDGAAADTLIRGRYGDYRVVFEQDDQIPAVGSIVAQDRRLVRRKISVRWMSDGEEKGISLYAWRFQPEE